MAYNLVSWPGLNLGNAFLDVCRTRVFWRIGADLRKPIDKVDKTHGEIAQMGGATRARSPTNTTPKYVALIEEKVLIYVTGSGVRAGRRSITKAREKD